MTKYAAITFDIECLPRPKSMSLEEANFISEKAFDNLIEFLQNKSGEFTFFVNGEFLQTSNIKLEKIDSRFEISSHGYLHSDKLRTAKEAYKDVEKITNLLHAQGFSPKGFRFPNMQFDPSFIKILNDFNYAYDTSLHPTFVPFKYNNVLKSRKPFYVGSVLEIPATVTPQFRLPLSWFWLRNYPKLLRSHVLQSIVKEKYIVLYFHNWDLIDLPKSVNFFIRRKGGGFNAILEEFLWELESHDFRFISMFELCKKLKKDPSIPPSDFQKP